MIEFYYFPTPNCQKVAILLEECGAEYQVRTTNITKGDQFAPAFLANFPNNRIPAIIDLDPADGGDPLPVFESGAILFYLADKYRTLLPGDPRHRTIVHEWLAWQIAGLGPICGQNHHFTGYAPAGQDYAINRFVTETSRLYAVLDQRLSGRPFIAGDYSIADIACFPWIAAHGKQGQALTDFPNIERWFEVIRARPAVARAQLLADSVEPNPVVTEESRGFLFGQSASDVRKRA